MILKASELHDDHCFDDSYPLKEASYPLKEVSLQ